MDSIGTRSTLVALVAPLLLAAPPNASAQPVLPRFETAECFAEIRAWAIPMGVECGRLVVPELRERWDGPMVRLPVARLRAKEPDGSPPLVYLHGGPGGSGAVATQARGIFEWPIARHRDVIVYDHRGAGLSEPKVCPDVAAEVDRRREDQTTRERQEAWDDQARACVASLRAAGIDPLAFTTHNNVLDLLDLQRVLGYERWDLYGVSYGGWLAQEVMRENPGSLRAVVLAYSGTPGPTTQVESALSYQRSLEHLFASCGQQPACRAAFPTLAEDFYAIYEELDDDPIDVTLERTSGPTTIELDGMRYLRDLRCQLSNPRTIRRIPMLVNELRRGDRTRAGEVLAGGCGVGGAFNGTIQLVLCHGIHSDNYRDAVETVRRQVNPTFHFMVADNPECRLWQERFADPSTHASVKSDVPTLLLTGEFDERAPTDHSRRIAASLSRAWLYELPGESHGGAVTGCHASILFQFLENPTREPDGSCIAEMPGVVFETESLVIPTMILSISSSSDTPNRFVGVWEAELPNAPQVVNFNLTAEGETLVGKLRPAEMDVFDGVVAGNTIRFRVKSPDGLRTVTFTGELRGDEIAFTRDIEIPAGAPQGGRWIFGAQGVRTFTARRVG